MPGSSGAPERGRSGHSFGRDALLFRLGFWREAASEVIPSAGPNYCTSQVGVSPDILPQSSLERLCSGGSLVDRASLQAAPPRHSYRGALVILAASLHLSQLCEGQARIAEAWI